jgi:hypothetical protein
VYGPHACIPVVVSIIVSTNRPLNLVSARTVLRFNTPTRDRGCLAYILWTRSVLGRRTPKDMDESRPLDECKCHLPTGSQTRQNLSECDRTCDRTVSQAETKFHFGGTDTVTGVLSIWNS